MNELAKRTWPEARELFGPDLIAILPIGATEPHGPHLPLDTDVTIAVAQTQRAIDLLEAAGVRAVQLPPLSYGLTHFTDGFEGRMSLRPGTLWALLEDVVESLEEQGVRRIVFSNAHLEPAHVKILREDEGVASAAAAFEEHTAARSENTIAENATRLRDNIRSMVGIPLYMYASDQQSARKAEFVVIFAFRM